MNRMPLLDDILALPVFDTHTHLNNPGVPIPARTVWDILHYFWFLRELQGAGYPRNAESLHEDARIRAFLRAYAGCRHTTMSRVVDRIFRDLYGIRLQDEASVRAADEAVKASFKDPGWPRKVLDRLAIRRIAVNSVECADFPNLPGVGYAIPAKAGFDAKALARAIGHAEKPAAAASDAVDAIRDAVRGLRQGGIRGCRVDLSPFAAGGEILSGVPAPGAPAGEIDRFLLQALLEAFLENGLFVQAFLGVEKDGGGNAAPLNDPARIVNLHGLFSRFPCEYELIIGAELNNLDAVQAARIYPNVHVGGMWWYNFRESTYRASMQYRIEALPACRNCLIVSDARCIEWCFGKILIVKELMAEFLSERLARGLIDRETALFVAREWLHDAAARRYE